MASSVLPHDVLLVYKNLALTRDVSSHVGLGVTASNIGRVLRTGKQRVTVAPVFDGYELDQQLRLLKAAGEPLPTHVVMFAPWVDTAWLQGFIRRWPHIAFAVSFHSNVGFLQADRYAVRLLREQMALELANHNFSLASNCEALQNAVERTFARPAALLPNLYPLDYCRAQNVYLRGDLLRLGIFGAMRAQKNMLTAAWAAAQIARTMGVRAEIAINSGRVEGGESVLGSIRELLAGMDGIVLNEAGWLPWPAFRQLVGRQHLLLSPSYTESFCNVTADGVAEGVPSVVTSAIDWAPKSWRADGDDTSSIAEAGIRLLRDSGAVADGFRALTAHNKAGLAAWRAWLDRSSLS